MNSYIYDVSIVIPAHNGERFICKAIDSLINQNTKINYEIIVISDSNNDNKTDEILEKYKQKYNNFSYYKVENHSALFSKMDGVKLAKGKYISFLDCDDYYHKDNIDIMYKTIIKYDADVVNCYPYMVRKNGLEKYKFRKKLIMDSYNGIKQLFFDIYVRSFMQTKLYKASLIKDVINNLHFKKKINFAYEDVMLNFLIFQKAKLIVNIKDLLTFYNKTLESSLSSADSICQDLIDVSAFIFREIKKSKDEKLLKLFNRNYIRKKLFLMYNLSRRNYKNSKQKKLFKKDCYQQLKNIYKKHQLLASDSYYKFLNNVDYNN